MKTFNFAIIFSCFLFVVSDGRGLKSEVKPSLGSVAAQESDKLEFPKKPVLATSLVSDDSRQINSTSHSEAEYAHKKSRRGCSSQTDEAMESILEGIPGKNQPTLNGKNSGEIDQNLSWTS
ncbi:uncharacterized protein LOC109540683 isoform X2 [Dendroctonus ponderosae]|uniref:uncharacterized protein LOC109540683 isoform X2 n=1 Tax=Dendroctonus ponderosae TaxID=77166 RepID=UPI0020350565|nr:uncharacterized protein LOC109540683 isoform X2 [Dendroctonus ponderosae]